MGTFRGAMRQVAEYRIRLEHDVAAGIIPTSASAAVDACYVSIVAMLESARVELEAAGPRAQEQIFMIGFVGGWITLARQMFMATNGQAGVEELERTAAEVSCRARTLMEYLSARIAA